MRERPWGIVWLGLGAVVLSLGVGCVRQEPSPEVRRLLSSLHQLEQQNATYDEKLRDAHSDPGLRRQLNSDRELLKSRIERVREQLKRETGKGS